MQKEANWEAGFKFEVSSVKRGKERFGLPTSYLTRHTRPEGTGGDTPLFHYSIVPPFRAKQTQSRGGPNEGQVPCG